MSTKIATVSAVFTACEELDNLQKPWNRDDVRSWLGGGGYNVIDPLIKAWRKLKPIKEVAPSTPTELLHLLAEAIELNYGKFSSEAVSREKNRKNVFDEAVNEISVRLSTIEQQLGSSESRNEKLLDKNSDQALEIERLKSAIQQKSDHCETLVSQNDSLNGAALRLNVKFESASKEFEKELLAKAALHKEQTEDTLKTHKVELVNLKTELIEQNVTAENRLMCLLDQSRTDAKKQHQDASTKIDVARKKEEAAKEKVTLILSKNTILQGELAALQKENGQISIKLTNKIVQHTNLKEEYAAFKAGFNNSKFEEIKASIQALEEKMKPDSQ